MSSRLLRSGLLFLLLGGVVGCSEPVDPGTGVARSAIQDGSDDVGGGPIVQARRDATVLVHGGCTGTLVSPRVVVTADHCLDAGVNTRVRFGADRDSGPEIGLIGCVAADGECGEPVMAEDVGVLILDRRVDASPGGVDRTGVWPAIPAGVATDPIDPATGDPDPDLWVGQTLNVVGFGDTTDHEGVPPDTRQRTDSVISGVPGNWLDLTDSGTQHGDSGGRPIRTHPKRVRCSSSGFTKITIVMNG